MSTFYNKLLKNVTIKSTTTNQYSNSKTMKQNSYLTSPSIKNNTTYDNFRNSTYELYVPPIDNEWEDYARKYGEEYLNSHHNRSTKNTLK